MSSVSEIYEHVVGVDTHARTHTFTIVHAPTGRPVATATFPATNPGGSRALHWVTRHSPTTALLVVEGAGSYGAQFTRQAISLGHAVVEAGVIPRSARRGKGKTDEFDSLLIARSVIGCETNQLRLPRPGQGANAGLRVLLVAREQLNTDRTRAVNALNAMIRITGLGVDARRALTADQISQIAAWRVRDEALHTGLARAEATRLARRINECDQLLQANQDQMRTLVESTRYSVLLGLFGVGPVTAAHIIVAWGDPGRIRSEASFAALAGVNPIPASSGNTTSHRLNRNGDRQLNKALTTIVLTRMTHDEQTRVYTARRLAQGRTVRYIRRALKRYVARQVYRLMASIDAQVEPVTLPGLVHAGNNQPNQRGNQDCQGDATPGASRVATRSALDQPGSHAILALSPAWTPPPDTTIRRV